MFNQTFDGGMQFKKRNQSLPVLMSQSCNDVWKEENLGKVHIGASGSSLQKQQQMGKINMRERDSHAVGDQKGRS